MTSELSQMLDELMGKNRNAAPDDKSQDLHWSDKDVCKHFLCGFCPAELFTNTRSDLGPCPKIHDEALKKTYQQSTRYMKMSYEEEFLHYLQQCMSDVERRIRRNHQRLQLNEEKNQKPVATPNKDTEDQINLLTQRIEELLKKIEELGNEGNVEEAQGVMKLCDQLKDDRENLYNQQQGNALDQFTVQEKQMEVCEVCGAFLIVGDAQSRVDDHLMGKQHMGYAKIKTHIEELKEQIRKKAEAPVQEEKKREEPKDRADKEKKVDDPRRGSRDRESERRRSKEHDSRRSRDDRRDSSRRDDRRDSGRRRSRERDRDRDRGNHSRSRDDRDRKRSHRSRSRDRDRRHSRKHSRPRSRSRERKESKRSRRSASRDGRSKDAERDKESADRNHGSQKSGGGEDRDRKTGRRSESAEQQDKPASNGGECDASSADVGKADGVGEMQPGITEGDQ